MRSIDVSTAVYAAIWANRATGEESEDEILKRIFGLTTHNLQPSGKKTRWVDDIVRALSELGSEAHYSDIYPAVRSLRTAEGRSVPLRLEEVIRKEIETHSSDSDAFQHREDLFKAPRGKGAGYWALR